jgi:signal peptidase I
MIFIQNTLDNKIEIKLHRETVILYLKEGIVDFDDVICIVDDFINKIKLDNFMIKIIKEILKRGIPLKMQVRGKSMLPFFMDRQKVIIRPLINDPLKTGDIIAFIHPKYDNLIIHRIIKINNDFFISKGDAVLRSDGWISKGNILGVVEYRERMKYVKVFLSKWRIWYLLIKIFHLLPRGYKEFLKSIWYKLRYSIIYCF